MPEHHAIDSHIDNTNGILLQHLAKGGGKRLIFFCTYGQRSAMAVQAAQAAGLTASRHIRGGLQAWQQAHGPLTH